MVEPRMLMVSSVIGSRLRIVILTVRSAVFIFTSTLRMVPWTTVPAEEGGQRMNVGRDGRRGVEPFLSSTVTVSFWHFMRKLRGG